NPARPHDLKGQAICAFVTLERGYKHSKDLKDELRAPGWRRRLARPDDIRFTDALPKTRSGKIMRRPLRELAADTGEIKGDTTTLEDLQVIARLRESEEA
ncbi:MAG TPA: acetyl-coenzyme A synthetase, partial [Acidobacteriaceae bacterium]|nr:acetyl-coenzyme A synthetase [Acidobacteriaceae bacterium]